MSSLKSALTPSITVFYCFFKLQFQKLCEKLEICLKVPFPSNQKMVKWLDKYYFLTLDKFSNFRPNMKTLEIVSSRNIFCTKEMLCWGILAFSQISISNYRSFNICDFCQNVAFKKFQPFFNIIG